MTTTDAYSRHLIPDRVRGGHSRIDPVGFVHLSEDLRGRLSAGDDTDAAIEWIDGERTDVIYVGFGSMPVGDPTRLLSLLSMLAEGLDVRIVWCTGWSAESSRTVDPRILVVHEVDHTRLMARCAAVVHHGGAGTTAEAARAGKPQVIMPFFWDQPFWGRMVVEKNVGTCVRYTRATPRTVLTAVRTALSSKIRANAHTLAHRMRDETDAPPSEPPSVTCERYPSAPERRMCIGPHISLHRVPTTVPVTVLTHRPVADWSARSHMSAPPPEQRREGVEVVELEVHALDQRSDRRASTAAATSAAANRTPISLGVLKDQLRRLPRP